MFTSEHLNCSLDSSKLAIGLAIGVGSAIGLAYLYKKKLDNTPPKKWRRVGEISELICYPIKSCGAIRVNKIVCNQLGLEDGHLRDRVFMVVTPEGQFVTGRAHPRLVLVQPKIESNSMRLSAPGMMDFVLDIPNLYTIPPITSSVWQLAIQAIDCGDEVAKWLSRFICNDEIGLRLVFYPNTVPTRAIRPKDLKYKTLKPIDSGALHDHSNFMLLNETSLTDLNNKLDHVVPAVQFRPNFVVRGAIAFEEDNWKWIRIGNTVTFRNVKMCSRCIFTNVDHDTGLRNTDRQPLSTLKEYRSVLPNESPCLGIHIGVRTTGQVSIGDSVYVEDNSN